MYDMINMIYDIIEHIITRMIISMHIIYMSYLYDMIDINYFDMIDIIMIYTHTFTR